MMRSRHGIGFVLSGALVSSITLTLAAGQAWAESGGDASTEVVIEEIGPDGTHFRRLTGDGTSHWMIRSQGLGPQVQAIGPEAVIVELREAPLLHRPEIRSLGGLRLGAAAVSAARLSVEAEHDRAEAEILRIASQRRGLSLPRSAVIAREYSTVFNGFAAKLSHEEQEELRKHPDVRAIHPDTEVRATLDVSVPVVGAPSFWSSYGYKGAGAVIAVVDTGVDYNHADLGGCFGPGCRVIGGYDFENDDSDPWDDNGHGTHVAGIAAGDGALQGVAPEASVLAYKVLDSNGMGWLSNIIAGIERAVDPDENGDTSDRADVINLSLGTSERDLDSPGVQAVENATAAGVLVVTSAGNDGPRFLSVGTPGIAPSALTVGATDDSDALADFSSRGPGGEPLFFAFEPGQALDLSIKPDMVAPGVAICSARAYGTTEGTDCLDEFHREAKGTSMSSPHVAGAAALLRGLRPGLSPSQVKSLLVNNSLELPYGVMEVGAGRLDVAAAASSHTVVEPVSLLFGINDLDQALWVSSLSLSVRNSDSVSQSYALSSGPLPAGMSLTLTPDAFSLAAGASISVTAELEVDNAVAPVSSEEPWTHEGVVNIDSGTQIQRVPFAFFHPAILRIEFDRAPAIISIEDDTSVVAVSFGLIGGEQTEFEFWLPAGTYDIKADFWGNQVVHPLLVVREGVDVTAESLVTIASSEAVHTITHSMKTVRGFDLGWNRRICTLEKKKVTGDEIFLPSGDISSSDSLSLTPSAFAVSDLSDRYVISLVIQSVFADESYSLVRGTQDGVSSDLDWSADANDFARFDWRFHGRPGFTLARFGITVWQRCWDNTADYSCAYGSSIGAGQDSPFVSRKVYFSASPWEEHPGTTLPFLFRPRAFAVPSERISSSYHMRPETTLGTLKVFSDALRDLLFFRETRNQISADLGPFFWRVPTSNSSTEILLVDPPTFASGKPIAYFSQGGSIPEASPGEVGFVPWRLYSGDTLIDSDQLRQMSTSHRSDPVRYQSDQPEGIYRLESESPAYLTGSLSGSTHVELEFDTSVPTVGPYDPDPPYVHLLELIQDGKRDNQFPLGSLVTLTAEISDDPGTSTPTGVTEVSLTYTTPTGTETIPVPNVGGDFYEASFPCDVEVIDLTLVATDGAGNRMQQEFSPALSCILTCGCDDGDACNGVEWCDPVLGCQPGTPPDCGDLNACILGSCDPNNGCQYDPVACHDDGDVCNGIAMCDELLGCQPGTPLDCDDGNPCTTDSCHPLFGCGNLANTEPCDDGDECTKSDTCDEGVCEGTFACTLDHFMLYKVKTSKDTPKFVPFGTPAAPVTLVDQFLSQNVEVQRPYRLGLPAEKNEGARFDDATHLEQYKIKAVVGAPRFDRNAFEVRVTNQCGTLDLNLIKPLTLLVPTAKEIRAVGADPDPPVPAPDPNGHKLDHYKCYKVRAVRGTSRFPKGVQVEVLDQFQQRRYDLVKPQALCAPVDKLGSPEDRRGNPVTSFTESFRNPDIPVLDHLLCYKAKIAKRLVDQVEGPGGPGTGCGPLDPKTRSPRTPLSQPKHQRLEKVIHVNNQFGPEQLDTIREMELCIPSQKLVLSP